MVCLPESEFASIPRCGLTGKGPGYWLCPLAGLVLAFLLTSLPVRAAGLTDPVMSPPSFPRQCLALENPSRAERSLISLDAVTAGCRRCLDNAHEGRSGDVQERPGPPLVSRSSNL